MMFFMSSLSSYLRSLSDKDLKKEIQMLAKLFPEVREYYQAKFSESGEKKSLAKYKRIIQNEFAPERGFPNARLSVARKAINDFSKLSKDRMLLADLMLFYVEMGVLFTNAYGDIDEPFYNSMGRMYEKVAHHVVDAGLTNIFLERFEKIVRDTQNIGWGFPDDLTDTFETCFSNHKAE